MGLKIVRMGEKGLRMVYSYSNIHTLPNSLSSAAETLRVELRMVYSYSNIHTLPNSLSSAAETLRVEC